MSKLFSSLSLLASLLAAARADALPAGVPYDASLDGSPVGTLRFQLEAEVPGGACRYDVAWDAGYGVFAEQCTLDEATWLGHGSCPENAQGPLTSLVVLAPGQDCQGFDDNGQVNPVFLVLLGEAGSTGVLQGLIQFTAATQMVSAFRAVPAS